MENGIVLDSFVDEITNSSTVIYTYGDTNVVNAIREMISNILTEAGVNENVDNLFKIEVYTPDMDNYEREVFIVSNKTGKQINLEKLISTITRKEQ